VARKADGGKIVVLPLQAAPRWIGSKPLNSSPPAVHNMPRVLSHRRM